MLFNSELLIIPFQFYFIASFKMTTLLKKKWRAQEQQKKKCGKSISPRKLLNFNNGDINLEENRNPIRTGGIAVTYLLDCVSNN